MSQDQFDQFDIYGDNDLEVFRSLANLVIQERVTGRKPTQDQIHACGNLEHHYDAQTILTIVMVLASGAEGEAYALQKIGTITEGGEK